MGLPGRILRLGSWRSIFLLPTGRAAGPEAPSVCSAMASLGQGRRRHSETSHLNYPLHAGPLLGLCSGSGDGGSSLTLRFGDFAIFVYGQLLGGLPVRVTEAGNDLCHQLDEVTPPQEFSHQSRGAGASSQPGLRSVCILVRPDSWVMGHMVLVTGPKPNRAVAKG